MALTSKARGHKRNGRMNNRLSVNRVRILFACTMAVALVLLIRLYFVQVVHGEQFSERASGQYVRPNYHTFSRGTVFFTEKNGDYRAAAGLTSGFIVAINPSRLVNASVTYDAIQGIIPIDRDTFFSKANKPNDPYEEVATHVDSTQAGAIKALGIDGVSVHSERWRYYPGGKLAAHVLGFVGFKDDSFQGQYGLERHYDTVLSRESESLYVNFFAELFANINQVLRPSSEAEGDIITSIEPSVQAFFEGELGRVAERYGAAEVGGIVLDPRTGAVLALGAWPSFDPNSFNTEGDFAVFVNPLVERVYEMGSIVKALTMAAGLDAGAVTADTTYEDAGAITLDGYTISNFDGKARGVVPMQEVLSQSLNTGAAFVAQQTGRSKFANYMRAFGLDKESGIDLPNETRGLVDNLTSPRGVEYATASFGQGIALTPIGTTRALAVLANGGLLVQPHVVTAIRNSTTGIAASVSLPEPERVIQESAAEEVTRMLVNVVDDALLGGTVANPHYSIAAKTGTAQIAKPDGGYYDDRYLHSFFGYFPAFDARFLVFLYVREPRGARYASQTLTEPFMDVADFLLNYYEVPPDR